MSIDESENTTIIREIEFNWERVVEKANLRREVLIQNSPKVVQREIGRTSTTDELIEPEITIPDTNMHYPISTSSAMALPQEVDDGPDRNVIQIVKAIQSKEVVGKDLTIDERRMVVNSLRLSGQTQDSISELLGLSRRTIVNDYKVLRQQAALSIANKETSEIAGEVYEVAKSCIRKALQAGHYKTVSTIMRDMVELLQSMGLVYRAPKTSMQASLHGSIQGHRQGYHKYMDTIGEDKSKVVDVLDCMFDAITKDQLN